MAQHIRKCPECGRYSMKGECPECSVCMVAAHPAKYSPDDRYGKYRRMAIAEGAKNGNMHDSNL